MRRRFSAVLCTTHVYYKAFQRLVVLATTECSMAAKESLAVLKYSSIAKKEISYV
jgi:hypothetical protein